MAGFNLTMRRYNAVFFGFSSIPSTFDLRDGEALGVGQIIQDGLLIPPRTGAAGTLRPFAATPTASDISGYNVLTEFSLYTTVDDTLTVAFIDDSPDPPEEHAIQEFASAAITLASNGLSATSMDVDAKIDGAGAHECSLIIETYHRTSGGVETLLSSDETGFLTTTLATYTVTPTISANFASGDRFVVKVRGKNYGIPA